MRARGSLLGGVTLAVACAFAAVAGARAADPSSSAIAASFVRGLLSDDPAVCALASDRLERSLAKVGGKATCRAALEAGRRAGDEKADDEAHDVLKTAVDQGFVVISTRVSGNATRRVWFDHGFGPAALVRELRSYDLDVRLGSGPTAARGTPSGRVVLDRRLATPTKLVLYTESSSGTIWRMTSTPHKRNRPTRTATRGVRDQATVAVRAFPFPNTGFPERVAVTTSDGELVASVTAQGRVDTLLVGNLVTPLLTGTGPADLSAIGDRLVKAWAKGDSKALCAELHPRLKPATGCDATGAASTVVRLEDPSLQGWSRDGSAIVAVEVASGSDRLTVYHLVTPLAGGPKVTGLLVDLENLANTFIKPL